MFRTRGLISVSRLAHGLGLPLLYLGQWLFLVAPMSCGFGEHSRWDGGAWRAEILLFHVLGCLVGLYPSAGHLSSTTVILNVFGSFAGGAWQCCGSFRDLFCQALCSLLCIQTKLKHCFCLLRAFWGLGWESPPGRKVCIKVKLLVAVWRDALVSGRAWPFPEPWPCHVLSFTSLVLAPAVGLYLRSFVLRFPSSTTNPCAPGDRCPPSPKEKGRAGSCTCHPTVGRAAGLAVNYC